MATLFKRQNKNGTITYRVQIRRKGIPYLNLSFSHKDEANSWIEENEYQYMQNPSRYLKWIEAQRLNLKRKREFE